MPYSHSTFWTCSEGNVSDARQNMVQRWPGRGGPKGLEGLKHVETLDNSKRITRHDPFKNRIVPLLYPFSQLFGIGQILFKHWIHDAITPNCFKYFFKWFHRQLSYNVYHISYISYIYRTSENAPGRVCVCVSVSLNLKWILQVCSMAQLHWEGLNTVSQDTKHRLTRTLHRLCGVEPCSTFGFAQPARIHLLMKVQMVKIC